MGEPTEGLSFTDGPYLLFQDSGVTDGLAAAQVIGNDFADPMNFVEGAGANVAYFIEPAFNVGLFQRPMDNFARLLLFVVTDIDAVISGTMSFRRGAGGEVFAPPELTDVNIREGDATANKPFIVPRLPMDFMRSPTGAVLADTLRPSFTVTPATAVVHTIGYVLLCVPVIGRTPRTNPPGGRGQVIGPSIQGETS